MARATTVCAVRAAAWCCVRCSRGGLTSTGGCVAGGELTCGWRCTCVRVSGRAGHAWARAPAARCQSGEPARVAALFCRLLPPPTPASAHCTPIHFLSLGAAVVLPASRTAVERRRPPAAQPARVQGLARRHHAPAQRAVPPGHGGGRGPVRRQAGRSGAAGVRGAAGGPDAARRVSRRRSLEGWRARARAALAPGLRFFSGLGARWPLGGSQESWVAEGGAGGRGVPLGADDDGRARTRSRLPIRGYILHRAPHPAVLRSSVRAVAGPRAQLARLPQLFCAHLGRVLFKGGSFGRALTSVTVAVGRSKAVRTRRCVVSALPCTRLLERRHIEGETR